MLKGEERVSYQIKIVMIVFEGRGESKLSNQNHFQSCWRERRELAIKSKLMWELLKGEERVSYQIKIYVRVVKEIRVYKIVVRVVKGRGAPDVSKQFVLSY